MSTSDAVSTRHSLRRPNSVRRHARCPNPGGLTHNPDKEEEISYITTEDGTEIFYKDWGPRDAQPIMFHHGWPLSSDDWDPQLLYFLSEGFRVVASDRRGHGRSSDIGSGHDMDHYASDVDAVVQHLDLNNAIHIGHSTGGGQVARYVAKFGQPQGRVAKAVLVAAVPPLMVQTPQHSDGVPISVFDGFREALSANRAEFFNEVAPARSTGSTATVSRSRSQSSTTGSVRG
ncbi:UNVERIFIED_ORG: non-heme chloroperoxidase [Gordonia westfalica J30]